MVPANKKGDKQNFKSCRSVPLLSIGEKLFERILHNNMYEFFTKTNLISLNQSGFKPGDTNINQLLFITHEIYSLEVRGIILDISKAFDKAWHKGFLYNLKQNGKLFGIITDFLNFRKQ